MQKQPSLYEILLVVYGVGRVESSRRFEDKFQPARK
jgi:hypothetical protein